METNQIETTFKNIEQKIVLPDYLKKICSVIIDKTVSKKVIETILQSHFINYSVAKIGFLHLIFEYIK